MLDAGALREATKVLAGKVDYLLASERFTCELTGVDALDTSEQWQQALRGPGSYTHLRAHETLR